VRKRDLDRSEALLELIDNSIDAWNRRRAEYPAKSAPELNIYIDVDSDSGQLTYEDNAGGVAVEKLVNLVVPGHSETDAFAHSIGSYKTGGKKAIFRLAAAVNISTRFWNPAETGDTAVAVHLDERWLTDVDEYTFPYFDLKDDGGLQRGQTRYLMQLRPDPMVTNTYLKIALALLALVCVALALIDLRTIRTFENFRPLVIRIDDLGRAEAINYHNLEYQPQDAEAKYFLSQFCALYYRRNRYTIHDDFAKSLYFLDGKLANAILDAYRKDDTLRKFITTSSLPEIDIEVKKVALEQMQNSPFRARVDFYMVYYSPADHSELKRDLYTANFVFVFKSHVPNELIPINPLGLTITYFREDQAFK
jgi:type IV secretory pathway TrbF-like protein